MKQIFWKMYDAAANDGAGGAPDATAVVLKAIDGMKAGMVKKEDVTAIAGAEITKANEPIIKSVAEIQAQLNKLDEKAGMFSAPNVVEKDAANQISEHILKNLGKEGQLPKTQLKNFDRMVRKTAGTMTVADDLTAGSSVITYKPGIEALPGRLVNFRNLVTVTPSSTGTFVFYREGTKEGSVAYQETHGAKKSIINARMAGVTVTTEYLAGLAPIAKQMVQDLPFMASFLPQFLLREYLFQEDAEFYDVLLNAATGSTTISGSPTVDVEQVMGWIANLQAANYQPNGIVINPADMYKILITKPSDYSLPAGVSVTPSGGMSIMGVPVFLSTFIAEDKVLVGDWSKATIIQTDGLAVLSDPYGDNFDNNTITYKVEARVGLAVLQPAAFIYGDLGNVT